MNKRVSCKTWLYVHLKDVQGQTMFIVSPEQLHTQT